MTDQTLYTGQTPSLPNGGPDGNNAYTLGTVIIPDANGNVKGIRWYYPQTLPSQPVIGVLYQWSSAGGGVELARKAFSSPVAGTWNTALLDVPIAVTAGQRYVAAVWTRDRYVLLANGAASPLVNGHLTAPANDPTGPPVVYNGALLGIDGGTGPTYPTQNTSGSSYLVDFVYEASEAPPIPIVPSGGLANPGGANRWAIRTWLRDWIEAQSIPGLLRVYRSGRVELSFDELNTGGTPRPMMVAAIASLADSEDRLANGGANYPGGKLIHYTVTLRTYHRAPEGTWDEDADQEDHDRIIDALKDCLRARGRDLGRPQDILGVGEYPRVGGIVFSEEEAETADDGATDRWGTFSFTITQYLS